MPSQFRALEAFAADADLLHLESLLKRFNLFEAIGVIRQELRHSDLLATFLDPGQSHGLGTLFLCELLRTASPSANDFDLHQARVMREWHNLDILIVDDASHIAIIVENKIDTTEHSGQLLRYYADVRSHFPGHGIIALYLTPDGDTPSDSRYFAVSYSQVCQIIEKIIGECHETLDVDVVVVIKHYAQMLRRHVVSDSDVAKLCESIYLQHRQALDLIFKHRPDQQMLIREYVRSLIEQEPGMKPHNFGRGYINFSLHEWDDAPVPHRIEHEEGEWLPYLGVTHFLDGLSVGIWVAPGNEEDREKLLRMVKQRQLTGAARRLTGVWSRASAFHLLSTRDYDKTQEEIEAVISERWADFLRDELPRIVKAVREEEWLWETP